MAHYCHTHGIALVCPSCRQAQLGSRRSPAKTAACRANAKISAANAKKAAAQRKAEQKVVALHEA